MKTNKVKSNYQHFEFPKSLSHKKLLHSLDSILNIFTVYLWAMGYGIFEIPTGIGRDSCIG